MVYLSHDWSNVIIFIVASLVLVILFLTLFFLFQDGFAALKLFNLKNFLFKTQRKEKRINIQFYGNLAQLSGYECGFDVFSDARSPFDVHFYLVSILFIIFDLEVAFLFPWAFGLDNITNYGTFIIMIFFSLLTLGFIYEWMRGALTWTPAGLMSNDKAIAPKQNGFGDLIVQIFYNFYLYIDLALKNYAILPWFIVFTWLMFGPNTKRSDSSALIMFNNSALISGVLSIISYFLGFIFSVHSLKVIHFEESQAFVISNFFEWFDMTSLFFIESSPLTQCLNLIIWLTTFFIIFSSFYNRSSQRTWETLVLVWIVLYFLSQIVYTNDFLYLYLALEGLNLTLYVLIALNNRSESVEASLKYMTLNVLATAIILFGIAIFYANLLTTNFDIIQTKLGFLAFNSVESDILWLKVAMWLIILGLLFKLSAFPLHIWTPDVYEGASTLVTAIMSVPVKIATFSLLNRFLYYTFGSYSEIWQPLIIVAAIGSIVWGCFGALIQTNIRRFLAYTTINNIGLTLAATSAINGDFLSIDGYALSYFYFFLYVLISFLLFGFILFLNNHIISLNVFSDFLNLKAIYNYYKESKTNLVIFNKFLIAILALVLITGMAGLPPFSTFYSKFFILLALFKNNLFILAFITLVTSVITAYYYLNFTKIIIFEKDVKSNASLKYFIKKHYIRTYNFFLSTVSFNTYILMGILLILFSLFFLYFSTPTGITNALYFLVVITDLNFNDYQVIVSATSLFSPNEYLWGLWKIFLLIILLLFFYIFYKYLEISELIINHYFIFCKSIMKENFNAFSYEEVQKMLSLIAIGGTLLSFVKLVLRNLMLYKNLCFIFAFFVSIYFFSVLLLKFKEFTINNNSVERFFPVVDRHCDTLIKSVIKNAHILIDYWYSIKEMPFGLGYFILLYYFYKRFIHHFWNFLSLQIYLKIKNPEDLSIYLQKALILKVSVVYLFYIISFGIASWIFL